MRIDEATDLAEQVESALRALGIASLPAADNRTGNQSTVGVSKAVSSLRKWQSLQEVRGERLSPADAAAVSQLETESR